jgi:hypothetical protein
VISVQSIVKKGIRRMSSVRTWMVVAALLSTVLGSTLTTHVPAQAQSPVVGMDWKMVARWDGKGEGQPQVGGYPVTVTLSDTRKCDPQGIEWTIQGGAPSQLPVTTPGCSILITFPKEGVFDVQAKLLSRNERWVRSIVVQDFLIAVLGDSNASGEGNPGVGGFANPDCHRSALSGHAQASKRIENDVNTAAPNELRSTVTLIDLACSGASISRGGLFLKYDGMIDDGVTQPPQVDTLVQIVNGREVDAIIMSAGVNDLGNNGFGEVITGCVKHPSCDLDSPFSESREVDGNLKRIPDLYDQIAGGFATRSLPLNRTFVTEYPLLGEDELGQTCVITALKEALRDPEAGVGIGSLLGVLDSAIDLDADEMVWLDVTSGLLSAAIRKQAAIHGMTYVGGIATGFRKHGYCATESARFIRTLGESKFRQDGKDGAFHPNLLGHAVTREAILNKLRPALFPNGLPRAPKGFSIAFPITTQLSNGATTTTVRPKVTTTTAKVNPIVTTPSTAPQATTTSTAPSTPTTSTTVARASTTVPTSTNSTLPPTTTSPAPITTTSVAAPIVGPSGCPGPVNSLTPVVLQAKTLISDAFAPFTRGGKRPRMKSLVSFPYAAYPLSELPYPNSLFPDYSVKIDGVEVPPSDEYGTIAFEPQKTWGAAVDSGTIWTELYLVGYGGALPKRVVVKGAPGCGTTTLIYVI